MIILSANNITKEYGTDVILKDVSFHLDKGDRAGIIGANGAGKTTLLKILTGEMAPSSGDFFVSQDTTIGYLKQKDEFEESGTVLQAVENIFADLADMESEMLSLSDRASRAAGKEAEQLIHRYDQLREEFTRRNGYGYRSEIRGVLTSMAFGEDMFEKEISTLSGGEKTRLALACLLLKKPDLLFLDEPTNHLDIGTLKWLEQYLKGYKGTIVVVSHDRYFLNETVDTILEIERHTLKKYEGNYSTYAEKKRQRREEELRLYNAQQKEIEKQEDIIRRFKGRGTEKLAKRAASREKKLARIERIEKPEELRARMKIGFKESFESGRDVIFGEDLSKSFGYGQDRKELFRDVDLDIKKGERICIVGPNGIGKTTLMRMIMGETSPGSGYIKIGHNVKFGYYDQEQKMLTDSNTVLEERKESYRLYTDTEMRSILGRFMFYDDMVFLEVGALSGGEKARLALVKLMLSGANVLLMDEPTNHLDIDSKEVFEDALLEFPGTLVVVSHDRYFLNRVPTRILELSADGISEYLGQYDYYVEKKQQVESGQNYLDQLAGRTAGAGAAGEAPTDSAVERRLKKEREAEERRQKRRAEEAEKRIKETEAEIAGLEKRMCSEEIQNDYVKLAEMSEKLDALNQNLLDLYEKWLQ